MEEEELPGTHLGGRPIKHRSAYWTKSDNDAFFNEVRAYCPELEIVAPDRAVLGYDAYYALNSHLKYLLRLPSSQGIVHPPPDDVTCWSHFWVGALPPPNPEKWALRISVSGAMILDSGVHLSRIESYGPRFKDPEARNQSRWHTQRVLDLVRRVSRRLPLIEYGGPLLEARRLKDRAHVGHGALAWFLEDPHRLLPGRRRPAVEEAVIAHLDQIRGPRKIYYPSDIEAWTEPGRPGPGQPFTVHWKGLNLPMPVWLGVVPRGTPDEDLSTGHWWSLDHDTPDRAEGMRTIPAGVEAGTWEVRVVVQQFGGQQKLLVLRPFLVEDERFVPVADLPLAPRGWHLFYGTDQLNRYRADEGKPKLDPHPPPPNGGLIHWDLVLGPGDRGRLLTALAALWPSLACLPVETDRFDPPDGTRGLSRPPEDLPRISDPDNFPHPMVLLPVLPAWQPQWEKSDSGWRLSNCPTLVFRLNPPGAPWDLGGGPMDQDFPESEGPDPTPLDPDPPDNLSSTGLMIPWESFRDPWVTCSFSRPDDALMELFISQVRHTLNHLCPHGDLVSYGGLFSEPMRRIRAGKPEKRERWIGPGAWRWLQADPARTTSHIWHPVTDTGAVVPGLQKPLLISPINGLTGIICTATPFRPAPGAGVTVAWRRAAPHGPWRLGVVPRRTADDDTTTGHWWSIPADSPSGSRQVAGGLAKGIWEIRAIGRPAAEADETMLIVVPFKVADPTPRARNWSRQKDMPKASDASLARFQPDTLMDHYNAPLGRTTIPSQEARDEGLGLAPFVAF